MGGEKDSIQNLVSGRIEQNGKTTHEAGSKWTKYDIYDDMMSGRNMTLIEVMVTAERREK